jgi:hypothetical protein
LTHLLDQALLFLGRIGGEQVDDGEVRTVGYDLRQLSSSAEIFTGGEPFKRRQLPPTGSQLVPIDAGMRFISTHNFLHAGPSGRPGDPAGLVDALHRWFGAPPSGRAYTYLDLVRR